MVVLTCLIVTIPINAVWVLIDYITLAIGKFKHADGSDLYEPIYILVWLPIIFLLLKVATTVSGLYSMASSFAGGGFVN